jgi:hypothetical protein
MKLNGVSVEEFFLKIFKFVVLAVMGLAVLVTAGGLLYSAFQYAQSPKEPMPAKTAPAQSVNIDEFLNQLKPKPQSQPSQREDEKSDEEPSAPVKPAVPKYSEEAKQIFNCAKDSNLKAGRDVPNDRLVDNIREYLNSNAVRKNRGDAWVSDSAKFTCSVLSNAEVIVLKKKNADLQVLGPAIQFHLQKWDEIQNDIAQFDREEQQRINSEIRDEEIRVMIAKTKAFTALIAAGVAFAIFMALALYLIISAIESNLRNINQSIQSFHKKEDSHTLEDDLETTHN